MIGDEHGPSSTAPAHIRENLPYHLKASLRAAACGGRPRPARPNCGFAAITCSKLGRSYSTYCLVARHFKLPIRFMNNINQIDLTTRDSCLSHSDYSPVPR
jgi:broad specificity phosphatase PhoE